MSDWQGPQLWQRSGPQPPARDPPFRVTIPAKTWVTFTDWIRLEEYLYSCSPEAKVEWTLRFAKEPQPTGVFSVQLPLLESRSLR